MKNKALVIVLLAFQAALAAAANLPDLGLSPRALALATLVNVVVGVVLNQLQPLTGRD